MEQNAKITNPAKIKNVVMRTCNPPPYCFLINFTIPNINDIASDVRDSAKEM